MRNAFLFCLTLCSVLLFAQSIPTVEGVKRQSSFIAAKQTALLGQTEKAIGLFETLIEAAPEMDAAHFELGRLHFATQDNDAAIDRLKKAYQLRPNEVYAAFLAEIYEASGRYKEGADLFGGMIKRDPKRTEFYLERAEFLVRAQDIKGAIGTYDDLEDRIGVNLELARNKHALYLGQDDQKRAEKELTALVASQPRNPRFLHMLAGYYESRGDAGKARKVYRNILAVQPGDVRARIALQDAAPTKNSGNDGDLMTMLGRTDVDIDLKIGKLLPLVADLARTRDAKVGERASLLAAELRRVHPDEAKASAIQGDVFFHTGRYAEAAEAYAATVDLDATVYPVWEQLLATLYLDNQSVKLRKYAEEALDVFPNRPAVYVHYALGEAMRADFSEANSLLEQARLMTSGQPEATAQLSALGAALAGLEAGDATAKIEMAKLPGGKEGPLAFLLANGGKATALIAYDQPANTNALFLELLGDAQAKAGDKAAAAKAYARAKAAGSKSTNLRGKMSKVQ